MILREAAMKRHASLHPLSQHHHFALTQALLMRRATQVPASRRAEALRQAARTFLRFWNKTGVQHFREEEEVLLPAYSRHVRLDQDPAVMRMLAVHAEIRVQILQLKTLLEAEARVEEAVAALARALHDHIRHEENEIFPRIEKTLAEADLLALGMRLTRLHPEKSCEV
jgi:hemerythrin-like domain-containing protein